MKEMKHDSSTLSWSKLGDEWLELAPTGESRMRFIMPRMLDYLGNVRDLKILDLGCGEGGYSRQLARNGADVTAIDCSEKAIVHSQRLADEENLLIDHYVRNSNDLFDIPDAAFDIAMCSMMLMDCEDLDGTIRECVRILKPGGELVLSILHPCFNANPDTGIGRQGHGHDRQVVVNNYFDPHCWQAPLNGGTIPLIWRHRTLEEYVRTFIRRGLVIADVYEPRATQEEADSSLTMAFLRRVPLYLYMKLIKP